MLSLFRGSMIPCIYALMTTKSQFAYTCMLHNIRAVCDNVGLFLNPPSFMTDYEKGARNAYQSIWDIIFTIDNAYLKNL